MAYAAASDVNETGNFTEFNTLIGDTNDEINLTSDYGFVDGDGDVLISKSIKINGNGHKLDNAESSIVINSNASVIFENVNFFNPQFKASHGSDSLNLTLINCNFTFPNKGSSDYIYMGPTFELQNTGNISPTVKKLAKSIVGDSKDYDAAYKLAKWVGKNICHETAPGFYQTPDMTLKRRLGNCCSQTDLFLQMCAAIGLNKNHKLYYVHVGTMNFGNRHFFAMFDNILVDVDAKPKSPWGHAYFGKYKFYRITEYPCLPLLRKY